MGLFQVSTTKICNCVLKAALVAAKYLRHHMPCGDDDGRIIIVLASTHSYQQTHDATAAMRKSHILS
jgi:hypothetical protein